MPLTSRQCFLTSHTQPIIRPFLLVPKLRLGHAFPPSSASLHRRSQRSTGWTLDTSHPSSSLDTAICGGAPTRWGGQKILAFHPAISIITYTILLYTNIPSGHAPGAPQELSIPGKRRIVPRYGVPMLPATPMSNRIRLKTLMTTAPRPPKATEAPTPPSDYSCPKRHAINETYRAGKLGKATPSGNTRYWQNRRLVDQLISTPDIGKIQSSLTNSRPEEPKACPAEAICPTCPL